MELMVIEVNGVPDIEAHKQIADKLKMHFLRRSNHGADVLMVIYPTSNDGQAYVVFESKEVPGVLECPHVLEVKNRLYPLNVHQADRSEVDMKVEATLDISAFKRSDVKQLLDSQSGFKVKKFTRDELTLEGSFLNLKLLNSRLTQHFAGDIQNNIISPSALVNGHSQMPVSQMEPYSQEPRAAKSSAKQVTDGKMYAGARSPIVNDLDDSSHNLPIPKPKSPEYSGSSTNVSPRNFTSFDTDFSPSSHYSTPPSSSRKVSFQVDTDALNYMLKYRQEIIQEIEMKYSSEMSIKDEVGLSTVTFMGKDCERAKERFMNIHDHIEPLLRTQEIHLNQYSRRRQAEIWERIKLYKDSGVLIQHHDNIIKLVGSSRKSYEIMQLLVSEPADSSARGRSMERGSKNRSSSLPKHYKDSVNVQDYNPTTEHQASVAREYSPMRYQEEQGESQAAAQGQTSKKKVHRRTHSAEPKMKKKDQPKHPDEMQLDSSQEKSPKKSPRLPKPFIDLKKKFPKWKH